MARLLHSQPYNTTYDPPFPEIDFVLANITTGDKTDSLRGLIDSGSDCCLIPNKILKAINLVPLEKQFVRGISGPAYQLDLYFAQLTIGGFVLPSIQIMGRNNSEEIILGRNVLNNFEITLNGLASVTEIKG